VVAKCEFSFVLVNVSKRVRTDLWRRKIFLLRWHGLGRSAPSFEFFVSQFFSLMFVRTVCSSCVRLCVRVFCAKQRVILFLIDLFVERGRRILLYTNVQKNKQHRLHTHTPISESKYSNFYVQILHITWWPGPSTKKNKFTHAHAKDGWRLPPSA